MKLDLGGSELGPLEEQHVLSLKVEAGVFEVCSILRHRWRPLEGAREEGLAKPFTKTVLVKIDQITASHQ